MTSDDAQNVKALMQGGAATPNGRCCVFQPFDKGPFDKRYDDVIAPAIGAAGLESYRVDRDDGVVIPFETLHDEIKTATLCLADISTVNPNVMYELGYAIASGKDVIIISSNQAEKFPFDIQHRVVIKYASDSISDFENLMKSITARAKALLQRQTTTASIAAASPVKTTEGFRPHEVASLVFVMENSVGGEAAFYEICNDMEKAGYSKRAAQLGLLLLSREGYVETRTVNDSYNNATYPAYYLTTKGEDWLLENQDKLEIRLPKSIAPQELKLDCDPKDAITDDDVPF
jgi:hypothetical protein